MAEQVIGFVGVPPKAKKTIEVEPTIIDVEPTKVEEIKPKKTTKK